MNEIILCKYGEIILKGANRPHFEALLSRELKRRAARHGGFSVRVSQSTVSLEPQSEASDLDGMFESVLTVFGINAAVRATVCEKTPEAILAAAREYLPEQLAGCRTFGVEAKRSDKAFPWKSPEIAARVGGVILEALPRLKVDLEKPDVMIRVEIRDRYACLHGPQKKAAGGIPIGSSGRGVLLLSGGIDSPVAGYMMAKRGMQILPLHFDSFPYTSERAREKVMRLARLISPYTCTRRAAVLSLTEIQEAIRDTCDEDYFTLLLRRFMMHLAERYARENDAGALITGESLGQVASQTTPALAATGGIVSLPVFRPCIGLDKEEIVSLSRRIGTFDTSIEPYEDCCTVFTPRHPKTRPELAKLLAEEGKLDFPALADRAYATLQTVSLF
ncbi:MAG: tRNA 4-thiouridine(8) synthase ThiI [Clostridia bacterium]|nr:tRNA 4-thiouridine(8) synthase ThiI [Clostridia bacterium]